MTADIVFVVLHYKVFDVTDKCLQKLSEQQYDNFHIIVVDNYSDNGSEEKLKKKYQNADRTEFVSMERNYGFAKANDAGYLVAKHKYNADIIVIMNNDVMIDDLMFCQKLNEKYASSEYGIVGPDIINMQGSHQNPEMNCLTELNTVKKTIIKNKFKLLLIPLLYRFKKNKEVPAARKITEKKENLPLHGACLVFTEKFISTHEFPFYPDTFLYVEEEILYYLSMCDGIKIVYDPELIVNHMEDISTNSIVHDRTAKRLFELENSNRSLFILKEIMKKYR